MKELFKIEKCRTNAWEDEYPTILLKDEKIEKDEMVKTIPDALMLKCYIDKSQFGNLEMREVYDNLLDFIEYEYGSNEGWEIVRTKFDTIEAMLFPDDPYYILYANFERRN